MSTTCLSLVSVYQEFEAHQVVVVHNLRFLVFQILTQEIIDYKYIH